MNATPIDDVLDRLAPSETFIDDWDDVLARAAALGEHLASRPIASTRPSRFAGWRPRWYAPLAAGFALLVAVTAGVAVLVSRDESHSGVAVTTQPRTPALPGPKEIEARVLLALGDSSNDISHVTTALPNNVRLETWTDLETGDTRSIFSDSKGNVTQEIVESYSGSTVRTDDVRFPEHLWSTTTRAEVGAPPTETNIVDELRRAVSTGQWVVVGRETIDGVATIHLREEPQGFTSNGATGTSTNDLWVDASTYYPVEETNIDGGSARDNGIVVTSRGELIPRTPENLANLTLVAPPGFRHDTTRR